MFTACGDYNKGLPNGYKLVRTNGYTVVIFSPVGKKSRYEGIEIPAKITKIGISGDIVYGYVAPVDPNSEVAELKAQGYFILNTSSSSSDVGLSEDDFNDKLSKLKIDSKLVLPENL